MSFTQKKKRSSNIRFLFLLSMLCMFLPAKASAAEPDTARPMAQVWEQTEETLPFEESTALYPPEDSVPVQEIPKEINSSAGEELPAPQPETENGLVLQNGHYLLYIDGTPVTEPGWKKLSPAERYLIDKQGAVTAKMSKSGNIWRYYDYDSETVSFQLQKDVWKNVLGKDYYFSKSGKCTRIYDPASKQCKKLKKDKMTVMKKEIGRLSDGKLYYFNSKGVRTAKKGWQKSSGSLYVQIGKNGFVTCKMEKKSGYWKFYQYSYSKDAWQKQKKVWKTVNKQRYYFNGSGKCTHLYNISSCKFYDLGKNSKTLIKNDIRSIHKKKYFFGPDGVKMSSPGLYQTISGKLIYVTSKGRVEKEIHGQLLSYTADGNRITSCRVRDSHFMCYYNGEGVIVRQIDLNKPMVALTYDDGPSQYTSAILDILEQHGSAATFFVVGQRVNSYPDILRRACELHCEIGNHTYSHKTLTKISISEIQSQINMTNDAVRAITGISPVVMRPPGGAHNGTVEGSVGMPLILWSIDTLDWRTRNAARTQAAVLESVSDGDIVLMHDLYQQTAAASSVIIPELVRRGYQLITVSELADCRGGMAAGGVYRTFR